MKVPPAEIKKKDTNFASSYCYWQAFRGPEILGQSDILTKFTQIDPSEINADIMVELENALRDESLTEAKVH